MKKLLAYGLLSLALSGCASARQSVVDLPAAPRPVAPEVAMRPIPPAGYFLSRWTEIFGR